MNLVRILLAAVAAFVAYMGLGFALFALMPFLQTEFRRYPAIYRDHDGQMSHMPAGMAAMLFSLLVLAVLYSFVYQGGSGLFEGARFGALIGLFAVSAFVIHNYVNLNIGLKLALQQCLIYFFEWLFVGIVIGLIYPAVIAALNPTRLPRRLKNNLIWSLRVIIWDRRAKRTFGLPPAPAQIPLWGDMDHSGQPPDSLR